MNTSRYQHTFVKVKRAGQEHVLRFWDVLTEDQKDSLADQIESIDFDHLSQIYKQKLAGRIAGCFQGLLEPIDIIPISRTADDFTKADQALKKGEELIAAGKIAAVLVAGGQGTRLGYDGPKGIYPVTPVSDKSLFQFHAKKIKALNKYYDTLIPWYIMTSKVNDAETRDFFSRYDYFGLGRENVFFFTQGMLPAMDDDGKVLLDAVNHIFENPDGHGGIFFALRDSGALTDLKKRQIEELFYFQVDNVLVKICDPYFIGHHKLAHSDMSAKVVSKRDPYERVGVIGRLNGKPTVIEYSDLPPSAMEARNPDGHLKYNGGSIAIHMLNMKFVERIANGSIKLPYHIAHKKIEYLDSQGLKVVPEKANGYKFEMFIFDALPYADTVVVMEVDRTEEFSPIKNEKGLDSPETARRDLINYYGRLLRRIGVDIPMDEDGHIATVIEISPELVLDINKLRAKIKTIDLHKDKLLIE